MEAYRELHRHKRNEEKRQQLLSCFQQIWTANNIFGTLNGTTIKWHLVPHEAYLPQDLGAWNAMPIRINRLSPSPDLEAEFTAQENFQDHIQSFLDEIGDNWQPPVADPPTQSQEESDLEERSEPSTHPHLDTDSATQLHTTPTGEAEGAEPRLSNHFTPQIATAERETEGALPRPRIPVGVSNQHSRSLARPAQQQTW
jgi:hypothetical protein